MPTQCSLSLHPYQASAITHGTGSQADVLSAHPHAQGISWKTSHPYLRDTSLTTSHQTLKDSSLYLILHLWPTLKPVTVGYNSAVLQGCQRSLTSPGPGAFSQASSSSTCLQRWTGDHTASLYQPFCVPISDSSLCGLFTVSHAASRKQHS